MVEQIQLDNLNKPKNLIGLYVYYIYHLSIVCMKVYRYQNYNVLPDIHDSGLKNHILQPCNPYIGLIVPYFASDHLDMFHMLN